MEIRQLEGTELQWAVNTANEVYHTCVLPMGVSPLEVAQYQEYATVENLWHEMSKKKLYLWGLFENGQMFGMSAMKADGQIMMLYINGYFQRKGIGSQMLDVMQKFAWEVLGVHDLSVNAAPLASTRFFQKRGFQKQKTGIAGQYFCPMIRKSEYQKQKISDKALIGIACGTLGVVILLAVLYVVLYLF